MQGVQSFSPLCPLTTDILDASHTPTGLHNTAQGNAALALGCIIAALSALLLALLCFCV